MEDIRSMGIVDLRPVLGDRVSAAHYAGEATVVTKKGKPLAALVPYEWLEEVRALRARIAEIDAAAEQVTPTGRH